MLPCPAGSMLRSETGASLSVGAMRAEGIGGRMAGALSPVPDVSAGGGMGMVVMRKRKRFGLKMETAFYADGTEDYHPDADIVLFIFIREAAITGIHRIISWSFLVDLTREEAALQADMRRTMRKELKRAGELEREGALRIELQRHPTESQREAYIGRQDAFAAARGSDRVDRQRFDELARKDMLAILYVRKPQGETLAGVALWLCEDRTYGMHAFSTFRDCDGPEDRKLAGLATKLLYWRSLLLAKSENSRMFDFGGAFPSRRANARLHGIDDLKYAFGALPVRQFDCYRAYTLKGKLVLPFILMLKWNPFERYEPWAPQREEAAP